MASTTDAVTGVLGQLRQRFATTAFDIVEYWDEDCCAVGITRPDGRARIAYISACGKQSGRYDVALEDSNEDGTEPCEVCGRYSDVDFDRLAGLVGEHLGVT